MATDGVRRSHGDQLEYAYAGHQRVRLETTFADSRNCGFRTVIISMIVASALIIVYWAIWFGGGRDVLASSQETSYIIFEDSFPAADLWIVMCLWTAACGIAYRRPWGLLATLLASGAGIYLGCMDVLFNIENGIYSGSASGSDPGQVATEIVINVLTFLLSISIGAYVWHNRDGLLLQSRPTSVETDTHAAHPVFTADV